MSKTILANVDGFTPVIDGMIPEVGAMTALIFGKAWRYCQMSDGVCKAAQDRIADELGLSRATINTHFAKLVEAGYLEDMTPDLLGMPHQYKDTGRANLSINLTATCQKSLHLPVKNFDTKKVLKKDIKENEDEAALENLLKDVAMMEISKAYQSEIGMLTPIIADELRDAVDTYPSKWVLDAIHESAIQNKRGWKYILAILKRWHAQGNQEAMSKPQQFKNQQAQQLPKGIEAGRVFLEAHGVKQNG